MNDTHHTNLYSNSPREEKKLKLKLGVLSCAHGTFNKCSMLDTKPKSLTLLCSSSFAHQKSVGNMESKIIHPNAFLIDNKSIKANWMEQQCSKQAHKWQFASSLYSHAVYGLASPFHRIESDIK